MKILRHIISWRRLNWINDHFNYCWTGMVMWKLGYDWSWERSSTCFTDEDERCYCGKFLKRHGDLYRMAELGGANDTHA